LQVGVVFLDGSGKIEETYSRFHVYEVHPDCSSIAVGTRQCRVPTSVVYLTNLKSAVINRWGQLIISTPSFLSGELGKFATGPGFDGVTTRQPVNLNFHSLANTSDSRIVKPPNGTQLSFDDTITVRVIPIALNLNPQHDSLQCGTKLARISPK
jgi:hypothetical protein